MKTFFFLTTLVVLFVACKKDKSNNNNKQQYLSKVFKDGLLEVEYFYDGNKRPYRRNEYSTNNGASNFAGFRLYEYNANNLLETISIFSKNSGFLQKYRILYDVNKQISRMDDLAGDNSI